MIASDNWSITFGCAETSSSETFLLRPEKVFGNVLKIITLTELPDSVTLCLNCLSKNFPPKNPCQFRREVKNVLEVEA